MILVWLVLIPLLGGVLAGFIGAKNPTASRWVSLIALALDSILALGLASQYLVGTENPSTGPWFVEWSQSWIPQFGVSLHLAVDGLSLVMVLLTLFLGLIGVGASWTEIKDRVGFFHFNFLWILSGVLGVFLAIDLFLFFFFWEVMLIPMYLLIRIWGHENRQYAAVKFFLFTQASGLLMLIAIVALALLQRVDGSGITFDYNHFLNHPVEGPAAKWIMLGFFVAFATKLPAFPFHPWLPDAHTEAPTAGSIILAGILLKTGAYGMLRFVLPLFPMAVQDFATTAMLLGVIGILYAAVMAYAQDDMKRLVAYTSVSHMGFVLLGIFAGTEFALKGVVMQMICHGLSAGAQFMLVGSLYERIHTRDMRKMGGLWSTLPGFGVASMFFAMASLGLPGMGNFIAEFLILVGAYQVAPKLTIVATLGLVGATLYSLRLIRRAFHGPLQNPKPFTDLTLRERFLAGAFALGLLWLGVYPQPAIDATAPTLQSIQNRGVVDLAQGNPPPGESK